MERLQRPLLGASIALGLLWCGLGLARYHSFHNETFDLAFYTRLAWGMAHLSFWEPIVGAHLLGLHVNPVLLPLGLLGRVTGHLPELLLLAQAYAFALTLFPLAQIGYQKLGSRGALLAAVMFGLHPTIGHVATFEFHPSSLAVPAYAWLLQAMITRRPRQFMLSAWCMIACREDLALLTLLSAAVFFFSARTRPERKAARWVGLVSAAWLILFVFILQQLHAPPGNSVELHFGEFGDTPQRAVLSMLTQPFQLLATLFRPRNLEYLMWLFGSACFLPLLAPRWWLLVAPVLLANLISAWPSTTDLSTHYSTLLVPVWVVATLDAVTSLRSRIRERWLYAAVALTTLVTHTIQGQSPLSLSFDKQAFQSDARSQAARSLLRHIPPKASVQAPYPFLPHLAERMFLAPPPPPDRNHAMVVLDISHRERYSGDGALLRTQEEPMVRNWLSKPNVQLVAKEGPFLLFRRAARARESPFFRRYLQPREPAVHLRAPIRLADCLTLMGWTLLPSAAGREGNTLELAFRVEDSCPADLALRIGTRLRPRRTELLGEGLLSPAQLRPGDRLFSPHRLDGGEVDALRHGRLRVGLLRQSGARPEKTDPVSVPLASPRADQIHSKTLWNPT